MKPDTTKQAENSAESVRRAEHLRAYQFQPGESGNPGGRPKTALMRKALLERLTDGAGELSDQARELVAVLLALATGKSERGNVRAFEAIRDTVDGRPGPADSSDMARIEVNIVGWPAAAIDLDGKTAGRDRQLAAGGKTTEQASRSSSDAEIIAEAAGSSLQIAKTKPSTPHIQQPTVTASALTPEQKLRKRYPWLD